MLDGFRRHLAEDLVLLPLSTIAMMPVVAGRAAWRQAAHPVARVFIATESN